MSRSTIQITLDRASVRDLKTLISLASGTAIDCRIPPETTAAFAQACLKAGIASQISLFKRAELQTSAEARATVLDSGIPGASDRLPQFDKGAQ